MSDKKNNIETQLRELEEIAEWFEKEEDFDLEEGLRKVKEGAELVKKLKTRIKEVENEFNELEATFAKEE